MESYAGTDSVGVQSPVAGLYRPGLCVNNPPRGGIAPGAGLETTKRREATTGERQECSPDLQSVEWLAVLGLLGASLGHELAEPLSVAQLVLQHAWGKLDGPDGARDVRQDLQDALTACSRINELISGFRALARYHEAGKRAEACVQRVAERTIRLLEPSARQAKITVRTENLAALPAVRMSENDLHQVFFALTQHAVQAADGLKARHLLITGTRREEAVVLQFRDTGGGIDPAHLPRLFDPSLALPSPGKGTRVALYLARRIVCLRGGQISVNSHPEEGTTFTVILPRAPSPGGEGRYV
jgi:signal transduction histidine kinase